MNPIRLDTERLILRAPTLEDAGAVQRFADDLDISWCGYGVPHPYTLDRARRWIEKQGERLDAERAYTFLLERRDTGEIIGDSVLDRDPTHNIGELGYILGAAHRGQGFAAEAARAVVDFGFRDLELHKIEATCWGRNESSVRVLERLGFVREGVLREHALKWGRREDDLCYGLLRREWRQNQRPAS